MNKIEDIISVKKLQDALCKKDECKVKKVLLWTLAIVGVIAAVAGIAYAVYRYFTPDYLEDFEEEFEDDFDEECFADEV